MTSFLGILILIVIFFWLVWPAISRWLRRKAMEKAEDYLRSSMGMPPRDKKKRKAGAQSPYDDEGYYGRTRTNSSQHSSHRHEGPIIPKEYAEDVEFTETIDYSEKEYHIDPKGRETYHESQISDAEYIEIKKNRP